MQFQEVYEEVKNFFRPARLFEREFLIVPVYLPGHWAVSVVCRPLALVRELLGQNVDQSDKHARVAPSILYADSMGSKGLCFRLALSRVLVQHYLESNPVNSTLALQLSDSDLKARLGPEVSTPIQGDTFSCADYTLHTTRRIVTDLVKPSLVHLAGVTVTGAGGPGVGEICVETIMTSNWFNRVDALKEREWLKDEVKKLQQNQIEVTSVVGNMPGNQHRVESNSVQTTGNDWDVYCNEIATRQEQMLRERKLTADVMQLLASFQVHAAPGSVSGNGSESSCKPIKQQVSVFLLRTLQLRGHESLFCVTGSTAFVGLQLPVSSKGHRG